MIYSAHHDHLGIGEPNANGDPNDKIYNGARDNASGVGNGARDRQGVREPRAKAAALDHAVVRGSRGAGSARLRVLRYASDRVRPARSRQTSTTTAATSGASRATSRSSGLASRASMTSRWRSRRTKGARSRAISSPTAARTIARINSTSRRSACQRFYFSSGTDFVDRPAGWGTLADRCLHRARLSPAERRAHARLELRRHGPGRAVRVLGRV